MPDSNTLLQTPSNLDKGPDLDRLRDRLHQDIAQANTPGRVPLTLVEKLPRIFGYHDLSQRPEDQDRIERIRLASEQFAHVILENTPTSASQTVAIRKIHEARMDAVSAIASGGIF